MEIREERVTVMPDLPCTTSPVGPSDNGGMTEEMVRAGVGFEPICARGYGYTVTLCDGVATIERGRIVASMYGFARTEIPVGSIVDVSLGSATVFTNGLFCLSVRTLDGDTPMLDSASESRKSPYCAIYTKKQEKDFRRLYDAVGIDAARQPSAGRVRPDAGKPVHAPARVNNGVETSIGKK